MIPASLKIALVAGMLGGMAAALVLADVRANQGVEYVEGPSLAVLTDAADYQRGDAVDIRIVNSGSVPIRFHDDSYGLRITGLAGMPIFSPQAEGGAPPVLEPREERSISWDQTGGEGEQVFDGIYRISVHGLDPDGNRVEHATTISVYEIDLTFGS